MIPAAPASPRVRGVEVVGYDASVAARAALRLAVRRAGPSGAVVAVHACAPQPDLADAPYAAVGMAIMPQTYSDMDVRTRVRAQGEALLAEIPPDVFGTVAHRCEFIEAAPARAIVDVADHEHADEIVIGSRGGGKLRWMLGSVSHALLQAADRPLVVVPVDAVSRASAAGGDAPEVVIVGFDGSPDAAGALRHVVARVAPGSTIVVACATKGSPPWDALEELEIGGVELEREILRGSPACALAQLARERDASEIAVGSRGIGRFRAALGSVAHALLHEADRPVVVVPKNCC